MGKPRDAQAIRRPSLMALQWFEEADPLVAMCSTDGLESDVVADMPTKPYRWPVKVPTPGGAKPRAQRDANQIAADQPLNGV
jgi:hypothetical protein